MNRTDAVTLLHEYTKNEGLRKHALSVEAALRGYAKKFGEDEDLWGITGLLHDFDYEMYPTAPDHPLKGSEILTARGYPEIMRNAILGHACYTNVPRDTQLAKTLFACDELTGFITACTLVRPNKKISELEVSSVKKKMKDKGFARTVNRDEIIQGTSELGVGLDDHIQFVIDAMKGEADALGL